MPTHKPNIVTRRNPGGTDSYVVDAGMIEGKRHRKSWGTKKEAQAYADKMSDARASRGNLVFSLTSSQQIEAAQAFKDLQPVNATVRDAVAYYLKHAKPKGGCKTIQEFTEEFLSAKKRANKRPRYLKELRCKLNKFSVSFGNQKLNEISRPAIETWLNEQPFAALTKQNYHRDLGIFFRSALKLGYCAENVIDLIERPQAPQGKIGIFTTSETKRLLFAAHILPKLELVPHLAIGFFAGLRASELETLDWKQINVRQRTIEVLAANAKSASRRVVHISENLAAWLQPYEQDEGRVTPLNLYRRRKAVLKLAELEKWPENGLRHSFGSYHLAFHQDAPKTAHEMGHSTPDMLYKHYREVVCHEEAAIFWKIQPPKGVLMLASEVESESSSTDETDAQFMAKLATLLRERERKTSTRAA